MPIKAIVHPCPIILRNLVRETQEEPVTVIDSSVASLPTKTIQIIDSLYVNISVDKSNQQPLYPYRERDTVVYDLQDIQVAKKVDSFGWITCIISIYLKNFTVPLPNGTTKKNQKFQNMKNSQQKSLRQD